MIPQFPHIFTTPSGHVVTVTNPEKGKFTFEGQTNHGAIIDFNWYSDSYIGDETRGSSTGALEAFEHEVLHTFWQEERS